MDRRILRNPQIEWAFVESEMALVNLENAGCYALNTIGGMIYALADGEHTLTEIAEIISQRCQVDKMQSEEDLIEFTYQLEAEGLIEFL